MTPEGLEAVQISSNQAIGLTCQKKFDSNLFWHGNPIGERGSLAFRAPGLLHEAHCVVEDGLVTPQRYFQDLFYWTPSHGAWQGTSHLRASIQKCNVSCKGTCLCNSRCTFELMLEGGMCLAKRRGWAFNKIDLESISVESQGHLLQRNGLRAAGQAHETPAIRARQLDYHVKRDLNQISFDMLIQLPDLMRFVQLPVLLESFYRQHHRFMWKCTLVSFNAEICGVLPLSFTWFETAIRQKIYECIFNAESECHQRIITHNP